MWLLDLLHRRALVSLVALASIPILCHYAILDLAFSERPLCSTVLPPLCRSVSGGYRTSTLSSFDGIWGPVFLSNVGIESIIECSITIFHTCLGSCSASSSLSFLHAHSRLSIVVLLFAPNEMRIQWHNTLVCAVFTFLMSSSARRSIASIIPHSH